MKVISLLQPWASLIALGEKKIETRSWKTDYRGPLLIHASKSLKCAGVAWTEPFYTALKPFHNEVNGKASIQHPIGVIVARCNLLGCLEIKNNIPDEQRAWVEGWGYVKGNEYYFGDYNPGRYAWILENIEMLPDPIQAKGQLGLWEYGGNL